MYNIPDEESGQVFAYSFDMEVDGLRVDVGDEGNYFIATAHITLPFLGLRARCWREFKVDAEEHPQLFDFCLRFVKPSFRQEGEVSAVLPEEMEELSQLILLYLIKESDLYERSDES